jgi:hypothetical protein
LTRLGKLTRFTAVQKSRKKLFMRRMKVLSLLALAVGSACAVEPEGTTMLGHHQTSLTTEQATGESYLAEFEIAGREIIRLYALDSDRWHAMMTDVYGDGHDEAAAEQLRQTILSDDYSWMPPVVVVPQALLGDAAAAYGDGIVFMSNELPVIQPAAADEDSMPPNYLRIHLYLEEVGHAIDGIVNTKDSQGDEGALFAAVITETELTQEELFEYRRSDHGTITVDGVTYAVEFGLWGAVKKAAKKTGRALKNGSKWVWDKASSAAEDAWDWAYDGGISCTLAWLGVGTACAACVAGAVAAAPATAGMSLAGLKSACGVGCATACVLAANHCSGGQFFREPPPYDPNRDIR